MPRIRRKQTVSAPGSHRTSARVASRELTGGATYSSAKNSSGEVSATVSYRPSTGISSVDRGIQQSSADMFHISADGQILVPGQAAYIPTAIQQHVGERSQGKGLVAGNVTTGVDSMIARELRRRASEQEPIVSTETKQIIGSRPTYRAVLARKGYIICNTLGTGSYSKVKRAIQSNTSGAHVVAVKIIDRMKAPRDYQDKFLPRELSVWPRLKHPNLVRLHDWFQDSRRVYMVLEYADGGDALHYIQSCGGPVSEFVARRWISQICDGVAFMHNIGVAHRDLKLENILLDRFGNAKLCDFGFVRELYQTVAGEDSSNSSASFTGSASSGSCSSTGSCSSASDPSSSGSSHTAPHQQRERRAAGDMPGYLSSTYCGSKSYAAPEIFMGMPYDPRRSDVWALGVILYILVTGKMPFDETRGTKSVLEEQKILNLAWGSRRNGVGGISGECRALIRRMFTWDYEQRPTVDEVRSDAWFNIDEKACSSVGEDQGGTGTLRAMAESAVQGLVKSSKSEKSGSTGGC